MFGPFLHKMFGFTACLANFVLKIRFYSMFGMILPKILVLQHVWRIFWAMCRVGEWARGQETPKGHFPNVTFPWAQDGPKFMFLQQY